MGKLTDARKILEDLQLPNDQQNDRSAYTLLALLGIKEEDAWMKSENSIIRIHDIMVFIKENYGVAYAENTRETIRRQTIHQFEQAGLVERNKDNPQRPTNSPNTVYSVTGEALNVLKSYGTDKWEGNFKRFLDVNVSLAERYSNKRSMHKIPVHM